MDKILEQIKVMVQREKLSRENEYFAQLCFNDFKRR